MIGVLHLVRYPVKAIRGITVRLGSLFFVDKHERMHHTRVVLCGPSSPIIIIIRDAIYINLLFCSAVDSRRAE